MKKKLVMLAVMLSAFCFIGFAQEVFNSEVPRYIAQENKEKEYTFIVFGRVQTGGQWVEKREKFVIFAKTIKDAENSADRKFRGMYGGNVAPRNVVITCESIRDNVCEL